MIKKSELIKDIKAIIVAFDECLDNMNDRGCFDCNNNQEDKELDRFLYEMKSKYLQKSKL